MTTNANRIIEITEGYFGENSTHDYFEGFLIKTEKQTIKLGISSDQSCCEQFGYFMTNDDLADFIGAEVLEISLTDDLLKGVSLETGENGSKYASGMIMFVNIETSKGTLQFVAYNDHNGYYGHEAVVISEELNCVEIL